MGEMYIYHVWIAVIETFSLESLFFALQSFEFLSDIGIDEVCNILAVHDFWDNVHLPLRVGENVVLCGEIG